MSAAAGDACGSSTSDGSGTIAAEHHPASQSPAPGDVVEWFEFGQNGARSGTFHGSFALFPQASGFLGTYVSNSQQFLALWDEGGSMKNLALLGDSSAAVATVVAGFHGGAISLRADASGLTVRRFDAEANETASATVAGSFTVRSGAEDASGSILALTGTGSVVSGMWVDMVKGTGGESFSVGSASRSVVARGLAGGGVAVQLDGHWTALLHSGDPALNPAPAWLTDGSDFALGRAGKAYAVLKPARHSIKLTYTQSNLCGPMTLAGVT